MADARVTKNPAPAAALLSILALAGCYESTRGGSQLQDEAVADDRQDDPAELEPEGSDGSDPEDCRTVSSTVLWATIDTMRCREDPPVVVVTLDEASPYCGDPLSWGSDIRWSGESWFEISPNLSMCSEDWQLCDPGAVTTADITVELPGPGSYTARIGSVDYPFECPSGECGEEPCYLESFQPSDGRSGRLYGRRERMTVDLTYTSGYCGCSEFHPVTLVNPAFGDEHYYYGALSSTVCYDACCMYCDCIDTDSSEVSIEPRGVTYVYEAVFGGVTTDVRGFIAHDIADPMSECGTFPATIVAASPSSGRTTFGIVEPIDFDVTIAYDTYPSPICCEVHTDVAYDTGPVANQISLFAFGGTCMTCDDYVCPPTETRALHIPPGVLSYGSWVVFDARTESSLTSFSIVGED